MKELIVVGKMNHKIDNTFESINRVYSRGGVQPDHRDTTGTRVQDIAEVKCK